MSQRELVRQVRALGVSERAMLFDVMVEFDKIAVTSAARSRRNRWPDVSKRAVRNTGKKILPNLVLLERDEEAH